MSNVAHCKPCPKLIQTIGRPTYCFGLFYKALHYIVLHCIALYYPWFGDLEFQQYNDILWYQRPLTLKLNNFYTPFSLMIQILLPLPLPHSPISFERKITMTKDVVGLDDLTVTALGWHLTHGKVIKYRRCYWFSNHISWSGSSQFIENISLDKNHLPVITQITKL